MFQPTRHLSLLLAATVLIATPACATGMLYPQQRPAGDRDDRDDRAYYNRGLRDGRDAGTDDARRGRAYDVRQHDDYRNNRRGDDRDDLRAYRDGFESGYDDAYRRLARSTGDPRRNAPLPDYRRQSPNDGGGRGRAVSAAADNGYRDGLEEGQRAARSGDRFDPIREKRYREGDHGYERQWGSRDEYKREYRDSFQRGYETGYRGYRR